jgi:antirestriction protein ArdC
MSKSNEISKSSQKFIDNIIDEINKLDNEKWEHFLSNKNFDRLLPFNPVTGNRYKKLNCLMLMMAQLRNDWSSNKFMTFNQIKKSGGHNKGAKGVPVQHFFGFAYEKDENGNFVDKITYEQYLKLSKDKKSNYDLQFKERISYVFNLDEVHDLPEDLTEKELIFNTEENEADKLLNEIIKKHDINFEMQNITRAFYQPKGDKVRLPVKEYFKDENTFYQTSFHELIHWTGHESRLSRFELNTFSEEHKYATEELVAELGSLLFMNQLNIIETLKNSLIYLKGWLQHCKDAKEETMYRAYTNSKKAYNYLIY